MWVSENVGTIVWLLSVSPGSLFAERMTEDSQIMHVPLIHHLRGDRSRHLTSMRRTSIHRHMLFFQTVVAVTGC